jgi:glutamate-1-semialdehyde 2,1-aminomutase
MNTESEKIRDQIEKTYMENRRESEKFFKQGQGVFTGGMPRNLQYHRPFPIIIERGEDSRVIDLDGNEYIDFCTNFSSLILGHAHPKVLSAVQKAISKGVVHSNPTPIQYELAEVLCDRIPSVEQIRFLNSGTEAGMWVIRLARAFTGKNKILKMEGGYHGMSDALHISAHPPLEKAGPASRPLSVPDDHGIPEGVIRDTLVAPFNDKEATRAIFEENVEDLAAVIVEPLVGAGGEIPAQEGFLEFLRDLTGKHDVLLIFDEVISLRLGYGGAQERFNIIPDLCMMGKIIGGGFPVGAFGGRKDIMALLSPTNTYVAHSGTFSANSATMAAGLTTMNELTHEAHDQLEAKGNRLREQANAIFKNLEINGQVTGLGSCFQVHFTDQTIKNYRDVAMSKNDILVPSLLNLGLLNRGIYLSKKASGFISVVNTEAEIDTFLHALRESLDEIRPIIEMETPELIRA